MSILSKISDKNLDGIHYCHCINYCINYCKEDERNVLMKVQRILSLTDLILYVFRVFILDLLLWFSVGEWANKFLPQN